MLTAHQTEFHERLARINSGQGFTKATVYVGIDHSFTYVPKSRRGRGGMTQTASNAGYAMSFPLSMAIGFLCHVLERYTDFVMNGMAEPDMGIDMLMVKTAVLGFALTVVVTHLLGLRERGLLVPKLLGVAGGMLFFHNLVHRWPEVFDQLFSPIWVARITSMTEPHSIYWRGISFSF
jgi:hypothetical protein